MFLCNERLAGKYVTEYMNMCNKMVAWFDIAQSVGFKCKELAVKLTKVWSSCLISGEKCNAGVEILARLLLAEGIYIFTALDIVGILRQIW